MCKHELEVSSFQEEYTQIKTAQSGSPKREKYYGYFFLNNYLEMGRMEGPRYKMSQPWMPIRERHCPVYVWLLHLYVRLQGIQERVQK